MSITIYRDEAEFSEPLCFIELLSPQRPPILRLLGCAGVVAIALDLVLAVAIAENVAEAKAAPAAAPANSAAAWLHVDAASQTQTQTQTHMQTRTHGCNNLAHVKADAHIRRSQI